VRLAHVTAQRRADFELHWAVLAHKVRRLLAGRSFDLFSFTLLRLDCLNIVTVFFLIGVGRKKSFGQVTRKDKQNVCFRLRLFLGGLSGSQLLIDPALLGLFRLFDFIFVVFNFKLLYLSVDRFLSTLL
jgi:hypothetical protein